VNNACTESTGTCPNEQRFIASDVNERQAGRHSKCKKNSFKEILVTINKLNGKNLQFKMQTFQRAKISVLAQ